MITDNMQNKAFTLIELLVVIAIIGTLAGIVTVNFVGKTAQARDAKRISDIESLIQAINLYRLEVGSWPGEGDTRGAQISSNCSSDLVDDLVSKGYLNRAPSDPIDDANCSGWGDDNLYYYGWDSDHCCEGQYCISINRLETSWAIDVLSKKYPDNDSNLDNGVQYVTGGGDANIGTGDDFNYCFIKN